MKFNIHRYLADNLKNDSKKKSKLISYKWLKKEVDWMIGDIRSHAQWSIMAICPTKLPNAKVVKIFLDYISVFNE